MDAVFALGGSAMHEPLKVIWLSNDVRRLLSESAAAFAPRETGGVLIGYRAVAGTELVITNVVGPGPNARHTTRTFSPDLDYQHQEIARFHTDSVGLQTYIGDWHSHPAGGASLSSKDKRAMARVAFSPAARTPRPVMLILGGGKDKWTVAAWQVVRRSWLRCTFEPLPIASFAVTSY
jgi:integrative and conjugative element protein (TIGR02256 family)